MNAVPPSIEARPHFPSLLCSENATVESRSSNQAHLFRICLEAGDGERQRLHRIQLARMKAETPSVLKHSGRGSGGNVQYLVTVAAPGVGGALRVSVEPVCPAGGGSDPGCGLLVLPVWASFDDL